MQYQPNVQQLRRLISRRVQIAFVAGLLLGIFIGWLFSGVVSAFMRVGIVAFLLIPLAIAIYFWWRVRKAGSSAATVVTWRGGAFPPSGQDPFGQFRQRQDVIDADVIDQDELDRERPR